MNRRLLTSDGSSVALKKCLGEGGQGEVWQAALDGANVAIKLYHRHCALDSQRARIERLVEQGPPASAFLWPLRLVEDREQGTFGYVMPLRTDRFCSITDLLARRVVPTLRVLVTAALHLADAFLRLHARGLCYRDISLSNVSFDPATGDVCIFDNDNVDLSGSEEGGVLGTPRFMAPEIVRREALASDETDRYSLAVLLFHLLLGGHPLDGQREANIRCLDTPALELLYGRNPVYVFDPVDASNRPVPGIHDNPLAFHPLYPQPIRDLFQRSFTDGLRYPSRRVRESEWKRALAQAIDALACCGQCEADVFLTAASDNQAHSCWSCGAAVTA